jgi:hypothetical protein
VLDILPNSSSCGIHHDRVSADDKAAGQTPYDQQRFLRLERDARRGQIYLG